MANGVQELIEMLHSMVSEAWGLPLGAEKCVIERDKVLDILDEMKAQLPTEIAEARKLVSVRADFIANARREAESIKRVAEEQARHMVEEQEILRITKQRCQEMVAKAENRSTELKRVANEYAEDALKRTEDAISEALDEVRQSRARFRSAAKTAPAADIDVQMPEGDEDDEL